MPELQGLLNDIYDSTNRALRVSGDSGRELGSVEVTTGASTSSTTYADITGATVTVTVGTRPIHIKWGALVHNTTAGSGINLQVLEDGVSIAVRRYDSGSAAARGNIDVVTRRAPAAGSHTYKLQLALPGGHSATGVVTASATIPCYIHVVEC